MKRIQIFCKISKQNELGDLCLQLPYEYFHNTLPSIPAVSVIIALKNILNLINTNRASAKLVQYPRTRKQGLTVCMNSLWQPKKKN